MASVFVSNDRTFRSYVLMTVKITKTLSDAVVSSGPRWPGNSRLSPAEKTAMDMWCREVQQTIKSQTLAIMELQEELKKIDD